MQQVLRLLATLGVVLIAAPLPAAEPEDLPQSSITVLVDLSETWHNPASLPQNRRVLSAVGRAIASAAERLDPPIAVRYLAIGDMTFLQEPLCEAVFNPKLIASRAAKNTVFSSRTSFAKYVETDCVEFLLSRSKQPFTDISGALDSVARLTEFQGGPARRVIVLSDMVEDRRKGQGNVALALSGLDFIVVYRTLPQFRQNPAGLDALLKGWDKTLTGAGGHARFISDVALVPGALESLLLEPR